MSAVLRLTVLTVSPDSMNTTLYLMPKVVCNNVIIPDAKNSVPVISLLPTLSSSMHKAGARRIGTVRVATNIEM